MSQYPEVSPTHPDLQSENEEEEKIEDHHVLFFSPKFLFLHK
jgi:hypothetical protein